MKQRDETAGTPGLVLVKFEKNSIRDNIIEKKLNLRYIVERKGFFINAVEPLEVLRTKAIFQRVAVKVHEEGEEVQLRYNCIWILGYQYSPDELQRNIY